MKFTATVLATGFALASVTTAAPITFKDAVDYKPASKYLDGYLTQNYRNLEDKFHRVVEHAQGEDIPKWIGDKTGLGYRGNSPWGSKNTGQWVQSKPANPVPNPKGVNIGNKNWSAQNVWKAAGGTIGSALNAGRQQLSTQLTNSAAQMRMANGAQGRRGAIVAPPRPYAGPAAKIGRV